MQAIAQARRISAAPVFWSLWWLTLALQLLDAGTIWIVGAGRHVREVNPVLAFLEVHYGPLGATLIKLWGVAAWLALLAGLYMLALRLHSRALIVVCVVFLAGGAFDSAYLFWSNLGALLIAHAV